MQKSTWAIIAAACVPLVWGGIAFRDAQICSGLEDDYLNTMSRIKSSVRARTLMKQLGKSNADYDYIIKISEDQLSFILIKLHEKCGARAAETATRKANELIL